MTITGAWRDALLLSRPVELELRSRVTRAEHRHRFLGRSSPLRYDQTFVHSSASRGVTFTLDQYTRVGALAHLG
jgi:hypothetical protein